MFSYHDEWLRKAKSLRAKAEAIEKEALDAGYSDGERALANFTSRYLRSVADEIERYCRVARYAAYAFFGASAGMTVLALMSL